MVAEVLFYNNANPRMLTAQEFVPIMIAMREYVALHWWRENITEVGFDLEDSVDKV